MSFIYFQFAPLPEPNCYLFTRYIYIYIYIYSSLFPLTIINRHILGIKKERKKERKDGIYEQSENRNGLDGCVSYLSCAGACVHARVCTAILHASLACSPASMHATHAARAHRHTARGGRYHRARRRRAARRATHTPASAHGRELCLARDVKLLAIS